jgi:hypothetical protein
MRGNISHLFLQIIEVEHLCGYKYTVSHYTIAKLFYLINIIKPTLGIIYNFYLV